MSTRRGFAVGLAMGALGGFSGANVLLREEDADPAGPNSTPGGNASNNSTGGGESPFPATAIASRVAELTNQKRQSVYGGIVPDLGYDSTLAQCAAYHAENMSEAGSVSHGNLRGRYNQFGLGAQIPNKTIAQKIGNNWENVASVDAAGMEPGEMAEALVDAFDEEILLYRPWSLNGVGVVMSETTVYGAQNFL